MANTYTAGVKLTKMSFNSTGWDTTLNANADLIDAQAAVGGLAVTTFEVPSTTLNVAVAAGTYRKSDGTVGTYAGAASTAMTAASTNSVYLTDAGALTVSTTGFPAGSIVRLATVVTGGSTVTSVTDARVAWHSLGATYSLPLSGGTFSDAGATVVVHTGTTNGTKLGGATTELLGFWGATPVVQPSGAAQAAVGALALQTLTVSTGGAASTTLAAATNSSAVTDSSTGTASTTVADVGAAFSQSGLNNIHASILARLAEQRTLNTVLINAVTSLGTQVNNALADITANKTLGNGLRTALVATGQIKGSA